MSLKRRNIIAWVLLLVAALSWSAGTTLFRFHAQGEAVPEGTTYCQIQETSASGGDSEHMVFPTPEPQETAPYQRAHSFPGLTDTASRAIRIILSVMAAWTAIGSVFVLPSKKQLLGADGALLVLALISTGFLFPVNRLIGPAAGDFLIYALVLFLFLLSIRELWGWLLARFPVKWHLLFRLTERFRRPQAALLFMGGWLVLLTVCISLALFTRCWISALLTLGTAATAASCLWNYGAGLQHFKMQLNHFRNGQPIEVKDGAMKAAEQQLLEVQNQHQEAVKAAVASERFKVELISNVSHDLRTPLTAIVGYGELLEKEKLSQEGTMQLSRLNQKAAYMRELVDALFELTKVSSGVLESKKEEIDLVRLLEQTIGLMDDQLSMAGLVVRRHYAAQSVLLRTDGSRMHQVFANLLGNAIKYALPGTRIHLEVKDTGNCYTIRMVNTASYEMDFDPDEIVQRFARGDKARSTKGSGLGLAIAQTYTESVGGRFHIAIDGDQFSAIVSLPKTERNL